jgi:hypothetical protein
MSINMKKIAIFCFVAFMISACDSEENTKLPQQQAYDYFVQFCEEDTKSANYDCKCQADAVDFEFSDSEMITLVNYLIMKRNQDPEAATIESSEEFKSVFDRLMMVSKSIRTKCKK